MIHVHAAIPVLSTNRHRARYCTLHRLTVFIVFTCLVLRVPTEWLGRYQYCCIGSHGVGLNVWFQSGHKCSENRGLIHKDGLARHKDGLARHKDGLAFILRLSE